jgi:hypothetical protein
MHEVTVSVDSDHLEKYVRSPQTALVELIWNALDADATSVSVELKRNAAGGVDGVTIIDDGHGITRIDCSNGFGRFMGSWKRAASLTRESGRQLHGSKGQGRFATFGLGTAVTWKTWFSDVDSQTYEYSIDGKRPGLNTFTVSDEVKVEHATGTRVSIWQLTEKAKALLNRDDCASRLAPEFVLYLTNYPDVVVTIDGKRLEPSQWQTSNEEIPSEGIPNAEEMKIRVIQWNIPVDRGLYLCTPKGTVIEQTTVGEDIDATIHFTAYAYWAEFRPADDRLADLGGEPLASILTNVRSRISDHVGRLQGQADETLIGKWISQGVDPFSEQIDPSPTHMVERNAFDMVATAAAAELEKQPTRTLKLTLALLKTAIESRPEDLETILREVLQLSPSKVTELALLLKRTTLGAIIQTAKTINDRLDFIEALKMIVFEKNIREVTKERAHLHRILAVESWIFGEEYALTASDAGLKKVLNEHSNLLGLGVVVDHEQPVDFHEIPDLVLSRTLEFASREIRHLVIELKRPSVVLGNDELDQLRKYAQAISKDPRFNQSNVRWDFWVIGIDLNDDAKSRLKPKHPQSGCFDELQDGKIVLRARTWADVIDDADYRLRYVRTNIDIEANEQTSRDYLRRKHNENLPDVLQRSSD